MNPQMNDLIMANGTLAVRLEEMEKKNLDLQKENRKLLESMGRLAFELDQLREERRETTPVKRTHVSEITPKTLFLSPSNIEGFPKRQSNRPDPNDNDDYSILPVALESDRVDYFGGFGSLEPNQFERDTSTLQSSRMTIDELSEETEEMELIQRRYYDYLNEQTPFDFSKPPPPLARH